MEEKNKAFKEFIIEASADAKRFLDSLTSEANRLEYLNSKVESSNDSWQTILNIAKCVLDDADGDIHQVNELSEKIYKHEGIDEAYHECYSDLLSLNLIVKSCMLQAKRIEGFAMESSENMVFRLRVIRLVWSSSIIFLIFQIIRK